MYLIRHLKAKKLYYVELVDNINHLQIIEFLDKIYHDSGTENELYLITDYRKATINEKTIEPIEKIGLFVNSKVKSKFSKIKWANISNSPLPTTGAILLHKIIKGDGVDYEPFTTIEAAFCWLGITNEGMQEYQNI